MTITKLEDWEIRILKIIITVGNENIIKLKNR
jgi:hypothetical protein